MNNVDPVEYLDFNSPSWRAIKMYLEQAKEKKIGMLITANTHDGSNQIRGALVFINELLALEKSRR